MRGASLKSLRIDEWLFLFLLAILPLDALFRIKLLGTRIIIADLIFPCALFFFILAVLRGVAKIRMSRFYIFLALCFCVTLAATLTSENSRHSEFKLAGKVYLLLLAILAFNQTTSIEKFRRIAYAWLTGATLTVVLSLLGISLFYFGLRAPKTNIVLSHYGSLVPGNYPRIAGLLIHPAMLCNYLSVSLMILFSLRVRKALVLMLLTIGILITAFFTLTPGLGGLCLSLGLYFWLILREKKNRFAIAPLIAGCVLALLFFFAASVSFLTNKTFSPSHRAVAWATSFETFMRHPVFGKGIGTEVAKSEYTRPDGVHEVITDAHNTWLSIAGEQGLFGLITFIALVWFLMKGLSPLRVEGETLLIIKTCLALALIDALLYQSLVGSFEDTRHLWVLFGLIAAVKENFNE